MCNCNCYGNGSSCCGDISVRDTLGHSEYTHEILYNGGRFRIIKETAGKDGRVSYLCYRPMNDETFRYETLEEMKSAMGIYFPLAG